ncbi:cache domain-containing protein [Methanoregula sp.]|uniref:cache domain-containing protein n=1 Tax=Methanoregula sp. TaxID=2052170 RepID=UPI003564E710
MRWHALLLALILTAALLAAACTNTSRMDEKNSIVSKNVTAIPATGGKLTPQELIAIVEDAREYARNNGREKAIAAFNDPDGSFVRNGIYIFAEDYNGTALAEPFEPEIVGTNIRNMTDRYGTPLVKNLEETAGYGIGYVSYDYPDMVDNHTIRGKLSVVADVDGTYYVGAGTYAGSGMIYPSTAIGPATRAYTTADLTKFVGDAVSYAKKNGREAALASFNDPKGKFADGELTIMAVDYNGTVLASSLTPDAANTRINLINYHDPDGVTTIREMRDLARQGGGISYTVAAVTNDGKTAYAPKIDYALPVDDTYWVFSGIIVPEYEQLRKGNLTGISLRNQTRTDLYDLVDRAVIYAKANGKEKTLAEINNPHGQFVSGGLFVWAEDFNGTVLADPFWKDLVGKNWLTFTDPYGSKITVMNINAITNGTGFTRAMVTDTMAGRTEPVPKLMYGKAVDDTWWIASGIYGVQVT